MIPIGPREGMDVTRVSTSAAGAGARNAVADTGDDRVIDLREAPRIEMDDDPVLDPYRTARRLTSVEDVLAARRLQAAVYVARGFISPADVGVDGTISAAVDPWSGRSTHFGVVRETVAVAVARQIAVQDLGALPSLRLAGLAGEEVGRIRGLAPRQVVEISGLARGSRTPSSDVVAVYVSMWLWSLNRHRVWVMAVDVRVFKLLRVLICGHALRQIGPVQPYMGSPVVPAVLWCADLAAEQRRLAGQARGTGLRSLLPRLFPKGSGIPNE